MIDEKLIVEVSQIVFESLTKLDLPKEGSWRWAWRRTVAATYITYKLLTSDSIIERLGG